MYIQIENGRVLDVFSKVRRSLVRKKAFFSVAADRLKDLIRSTFEEQRDPWGRAWQQLNTSTVDIRTRRGNASTEILLDSYTLYGSIDAQATDEYGEVEFDGTDDYAWVQQFGNPVNKVFGGASAPIPARPFLPLTGASQRLSMPDAWARSLTAPLEESLRKAMQ